MSTRICCIEGCANELYSRGWCKRHYAANRKHGDPLGGGHRRAPLEDRFWAKVQKAGPNDCWEWMGTKQPTGYGAITRGGRGAGNVMAHRLSYEIAKGKIPDGLYVLHSCDNPSCVNPAHLRCGTAADNTHDAMDRGRLVNPPRMPGELNCKAALTMEQVKIIRQSPHIKATVLARGFGVSHSTVLRVRKGKTWKGD